MVMFDPQFHGADWNLDNERVKYLRSHRDTFCQLDRA
jgi:hypothetical protein